MPTGELVLQIWATALGIAFCSFYYHPRIDRYAPFFLLGVTFIGFALLRHLNLRMPDGFGRSALIVGQYICLVATGYFMFRVFRFIAPLLKQRFNG